MKGTLAGTVLPAIGASPAGAPANTACGNSLHLTPSASMVYINRALSAPQTQAVDITFNVYFTSYTVGNYAYIILVSLVGDTNGNGPRVQAGLYNGGGTYYLTGEGASEGLPTEVHVTTGTWYKVHIHAQSGTGASYIEINDGTHHTFTQSATNGSYLQVGHSSSATADFVIGYLDVD